MDTPSVSAAPRSIWAIIGDVFLAPTKAFESFKQKPTIAVPLILMILLAAIMIGLPYKQNAQAQIDMLSASTTLPAQALDALRESAEHPSPVGSTIWGLIFSVIISLIGALLAWFFGSFLFKKEGGPVQLLFSLEGRLNRTGFWLFALAIDAVLLVSVLAGVLIGGDTGTGAAAGLIVGVLIVAYPCVAMHVKRCHDLEYHGKFALLALVPLVNIWYVIVAGFFPGTERENKYGPVPTTSVFTPIWGVVLLADLIAMVGGVLRSLLIVAKDSIYVSLGPAALLPGKDFTSILYAILYYTDIFAIWSVIVAGFGYAAIFGISRGKGMTISVVLWAIGILVAVGGQLVGLSYAGVEVSFL